MNNNKKKKKLQGSLLDPAATPRVKMAAKWSKLNGFSKFQNWKQVEAFSFQECRVLKESPLAPLAYFAVFKTENGLIKPF